MKKVFAVTAVLALLCLGGIARADVFNLGSGLTSLETVPVGDPGNAGELSGASVPGGYGPDRICGSVGYNYNIGKYEVTAAQYTVFLNAVAATDTYGLYNTSMWNYSEGCMIQRAGSSGNYTYGVASDWANRPVNYVSWGDSARFANWLHNGQPTGGQGLATTEDGAYYLNGATTDEALNAVTRKAGWTWAITSEDEWYKAAYYKGGTTSAGYWDYPTGSDSAPSNVLGNPTDPGNNATYYNAGYTIDSPYYRTEVGAHENSESAYGTFDQGGNVYEWNEAIISGAYRCLRGGSFIYSPLDTLQASGRSYYYPSSGLPNVGFRVSEVVPEPSSLLALAGGMGILLGLRRRVSPK